mgnify:CR=1 FL=1
MKNLILGVVLILTLASCAKVQYTPEQAGKDYAKLHVLASQGDSNAQNSIGVIQEKLGNYDIAVSYYEESVKLDNEAAQYNLAVLYDEGKFIKQDYNKAFELLEKSANQGLSIAQYNFGVVYDNGRGVKQDYKKAIEWYEKSANQGNTKAQFNLGIMYANGQGVIQDKKRAKEYFRKACDGGDQKGCDNYKKLNQEGY